MIWLDNSRIIAIFAVVILHVAADFLIVNSIGSYSWLMGNVFDSLVRWSVPVFVMMSGALLLDPTKKEDLKTFYIKRLSRILIPLLFWSAFFLFLSFIKGEIKGESIGILDLVKRLVSGKPYTHMWFLFMIVFLYLFTPFFRKVISESSRHEIIFLILITFLIATINALAQSTIIGESKLFINWFLSFIPYFFLGYYIRFNNIKFTKSTLVFILLISVTLTAYGFYFFAVNSISPVGVYFYNYLSITVIPMSFSVMYLLKSWTKPIKSKMITKKIASLTFGVYLIHPIFLEGIRYTWPKYQTFNPSITIPLISIFIFILSLGSAQLISKIPYLRKTI